MKKLFAAGLLLLVSSPLLAQSQAARLEQIVRDALPVCSGLQLTSAELSRKLPSGLQGTVFSARSKGGLCDGDHVAVTTTSGSVWVGAPWFLDGEGPVEDRLQAFAWEAMRDHVIAEIGKERNRDGLVPVTLWLSTARGKVPMKGSMDDQGRVFFIGEFRPLKSDFRTARLESFQPLLANAPTKGAANPEVTIIEFSDFECPSCKRHSEDAAKVLAAHPDKVRYIRFDLPLVSMHPWALTAAMAGRAVYRQKPERFWDFKALVYDNQDKMNAFVIDDFLAGFASDIDLDMQRYNADVNSEEIRSEILRGVGVGFANDIHGTPTYIVNGAIVDGGENGKFLADYVESLLKK